MPKPKVPKRIHATFTHAEQSYSGEPRHLALFADANNYNVRMIVWPAHIPALRAMLDQFEQQVEAKYRFTVLHDATVIGSSVPFVAGDVYIGTYETLPDGSLLLYTKERGAVQTTYEDVRIEPIAPKECAFCRVLVPSQPEQWQNVGNDFFGTPVTIKNIPACDECHTTIEGVDGLCDDLFTLQPSAVFIHSEHPHVEEAYIGITSDGRAIAVMHAVFEAAREDTPDDELYSPDDWVKHLDGEGVHLVGHYAEVQAEPVSA